MTNTTRIVTAITRSVANSNLTGNSTLRTTGGNWRPANPRSQSDHCQDCHGPRRTWPTPQQQSTVSVLAASLATSKTPGIQQILLIDKDCHHAERLNELLRFKRFAVETCDEPQRAVPHLRRKAAQYAVIAINVSDNSPWVRTLRKLQDACRRPDGHSAPSFLCFSTSKKATDFVLRIERLGARYVFVR